MLCSSCGEIVRPVVAIDIDGTLGDYHGHFALFAKEYFDLGWVPMSWDGLGDWEEHLGLTKEQYREAKLAYRQGGQKRTMPLFPGAQQLTSEVRNQGAELWLTTTRPWLRLDSVDPDTREWLRRNNIQYDHLLYDDDKYLKLSQIVSKDRVVAVLDDLQEDCERAAEIFGIDVVMNRANQYNAGLNPKMIRADLDGASNIIPLKIRKWYASR